MKNIMSLAKRSATYGLASALSIIALSAASTASILFIHQPETPSELLKKEME
ncbi:cyclic lactone autoinducer peptide [Paenibacillus sp. FSL R10-2771]|uniref:cyclic lactone autoinducer peptide n=1 Tax=Paenibacillus sp. FSL R10-2771 TaxID=2954693 RepID=UPI0030FC9E90